MNIKKQNYLLIIGTVLLSSLSFSQPMMNQIMESPPEVMMQPGEDWHPEAKHLGPGFFLHNRPQFEVYSKSNQVFAGTEQGNLYFRTLGSDKFDISIKPNEGLYWDIDNATWSPDGQHLVVKQIDDRNVKKIKLTMATPEDVVYKPYFRAGEPIPIYQYYIVNVKTGEKIVVDYDPEYPYVHIMEWNSDSSSFFMIASDRLMKQINLLHVNSETGKSSIILSEQSDTYLVGLNLLQGYSNRLKDMNLITFIDHKQQFIWLSDRSGYKQLYLYGYDGQLIRPLTNKTENGIVAEARGYDKKNDYIYFTAYSNPEQPYSMQVFKSSLSSNSIHKISDSSGIMDFVSSKNDTLWILRAELPKLLKLDCFSPEGQFLNTAWQGNFSSIGNNYFNFEFATVKAVDQKTNIQAFVLKPTDLDPNKSYPVVEYIYGAPFNNVANMNFFSPWLWDLNILAKQGFIVVCIDGRGTEGRGKAFNDFSYGKLGQVELLDHVEAIKQLAENRSYMNLEKVGIMGHSWGGHFALRALVEFPDFYKAGHINAPAIDPENFRVAVEPFMGCLPENCPELYKKSRISDKLNRLKAPLMIVHGTADDDVPIDDSYFLVEKLKNIGYKNYEFIEYQGMDHIVMRNPEWKPSMIQFFSDHLQN
ncbi:alpha/beta fold hydrolase [Geojedonia litorea]|uniref:Alpha/beta fold hydrolase n=1 Tax=Geojedonia litorea TaxID=1268269 RepID=A0ABV9N352_9FLAO